MSSSTLLKFVLPLVVSLAATGVNAQEPATNAKFKPYYPAIQFMVKAPVLLPTLQKTGKRDEMKNFADNWGNSAAPSDEFILAINLLMAAENKSVSIHKMPRNFMQLLNVYANGLHEVDAEPQNFRYIIKFPGTGYSYDATEDATKLYRFIQAWAKDALTGHMVDSTTAFVCGVFAGSISKPSSYFAQNKGNYAEIDSFENNVDSIRQQCFVTKRNNRAFVTHLLAGVWLPNGNLAVLGQHPSLGFQFGVRNKMNEYDLSTTIRFLQPTPYTYSVVMKDSLYNSNYYLGGYGGFDYTRYIIHTPSFEAGILAGIGYDFFDAFRARDNLNATGDNSQPLEIGYFDFNIGLHLKYFIHRGSSIGIQARYHFVNYPNPGGTDLGGNAVSIDVSFGAN